MFKWKPLALLDGDTPQTENGLTGTRDGTKTRHWVN